MGKGLCYIAFLALIACHGCTTSKSYQENKALFLQGGITSQNSSVALTQQDREVIVAWAEINFKQLSDREDVIKQVDDSLASHKLGKKDRETALKFTEIVFHYKAREIAQRQALAYSYLLSGIQSTSQSFQNINSTNISVPYNTFSSRVQPTVTLNNIQAVQPTVPLQNASLVNSADSCSLFYTGHGSARQIGNTIFYDDGFTSRKIGNTYFNSDLTTSRKIGNTYFNSDLSTSRTVGNTTFNSDGSSSLRIGDTFFHSDGGTSRITEY